MMETICLWKCYKNRNIDKRKSVKHRDTPSRLLHTLMECDWVPCKEDMMPERQHIKFKTYHQKLLDPKYPFPEYTYHEPFTWTTPPNDIRHIRAWANQNMSIWNTLGHTFRHATFAHSSTRRSGSTSQGILQNGQYTYINNIEKRFCVSLHLLVLLKRVGNMSSAYTDDTWWETL